MRTGQHCSNCYYAKNDANEKDKTYCIVKKEIVNIVNGCGYFLQNYDIQVKQTGWREETMN